MLKLAALLALATLATVEPATAVETDVTAAAPTPAAMVTWGETKRFTREQLDAAIAPVADRLLKRYIKNWPEADA